MEIRTGVVAQKYTHNASRYFRPHRYFSSNSRSSEKKKNEETQLKSWNKIINVIKKSYTALVVMLTASVNICIPSFNKTRFFGHDFWMLLMDHGNK